MIILICHQWSHFASFWSFWIFKLNRWATNDPALLGVIWPNFARLWQSASSSHFCFSSCFLFHCSWRFYHFITFLIISVFHYVFFLLPLCASVFFENSRLLLAQLSLCCFQTNSATCLLRASRPRMPPWPQPRWRCRQASPTRTSWLAYCFCTEFGFDRAILMTGAGRKASNFRKFSLRFWYENVDVKMETLQIWMKFLQPL